MRLYLHIPFCESKCYYCAFSSMKPRNEKAYMNALLEDIKHNIKEFNVAKKSIQSLFIGGGTPSALQAHLYEEIFSFLGEFLAPKCELTSEANPNSATYEWLKMMKELGLNRISFGVQSFDKKKLKFLGRIHNQRAIFEALQNAKKAGFENINLDLIYDTKLDTKKMLEFELKELEKLEIAHLSAYSLSLEKGTAFAKKKHFKKNATNLANFFIKGLKNLGFLHYEISNFAKNEDFKCQHNLGYWLGENYLAAGFSGVGFWEDRRFYSASNLKAYLQDPTHKKTELLSKEDLALEHLFLGLRSCVGIQKSRLNPAQIQKAKLLTQAKKLQETKEHFFSTNFLLADEIALYLSE